MKKKLLTILLSVFMLTISFTANTKTLVANEVYVVNFGSGSWTINDVTVTCDKSGTIDNIERNTEISLTNFNPETMEVKVSATDGFSINLNVTSNKTSLGSRNDQGGYPTGTLAFVVQAKNQEGPGPQQPELDQDGYPIVQDGNLKIMTEQDGFIGELKINNQGIPSNQNRTKFATKVDNVSNFTVQIQLEFGKAVSAIKLNNNTYTGEQLVPDSETTDRYTFNNVSAVNGMLSLSFVEAESTVSTIIWTYDKNDPSGPNGDTYSEDTLVQHGKVEVVSIKRGDDVLYADGSYTGKVDMENNRPKDSAKIGVDIDDQRGYVRLEKGDDIVIKLIPDYGYQLKTATINDRQLTPLSDDFTNVSTFNLEDVQGQMHFSGIFEKTDNTYVIDQDVTKVSNLSVDNKSTTVTSGTIKVSLNKTEDFDASSVNGIDAYISDNTIDITIDNIVSQGSDNKYWTNNISEFNNTIDVSMNVNDYDSNYDYKVVRKHTNGQQTEVSIVNSSIDDNGVLTFASDKFSSYMIVKKNKALQEVITANPSVNIKDGNGQIVPNVPINQIENADLVIEQHPLESFGNADQGVIAIYNNFHINAGINVNKTIIIDLQPKIVGKYNSQNVYADVNYDGLNTKQTVDIDLDENTIDYLGIEGDLSNYDIHVVREHGGVYERLNAVIYSEGNEYHVVFDSNKFSLYAIYATKKSTPTPSSNPTPRYKIPNTGVEGTTNNHSLLKLSSLSLLAIGTYMVIKKKKDN